MQAPDLDDVVVRIDLFHRRIEATRDQLSRLVVRTRPLGEQGEPTKRSVAAARLDLAAQTQAEELRAAALQLAETALAAVAAVRTLVDDTDPRSRDVRLYVRRLGRLASFCEKTAREAAEAACVTMTTETISGPGKHRR
jgi:hypothetical protein